VIQKLSKNNYIIENQMLVLNALLPRKNLTDKETKVLYCSTKQKEVQFVFDEFFCTGKEPLLSKLDDVDFRDTYRDESFLYHKRLLQVISAQISSIPSLFSVSFPK